MTAIALTLTSGETATVEASRIESVETLAGGTTCQVTTYSGNTYTVAATAAATVAAWTAALRSPSPVGGGTVQAAYPRGEDAKVVQARRTS